MTEMTEMNTPLRKITPTNFLLRMVIFLVITGFVLFILWRPVMGAFQANPWLNGLIVVVLILGILLSLVQVWRLVPEVRWLNDIDSGEPLQSMSMPVLLSANSLTNFVKLHKNFAAFFSNMPTTIKSSSPARQSAA